MAKLPSISGKEAVRAFERLGYSKKRQKGSHVFMVYEGRRAISVPLNEPIKSGTLRRIIRDSGFSVEEFVAAL